MRTSSLSSAQLGFRKQEGGGGLEPDQSWGHAHSMLLILYIYMQTSIESMPECCLGTIEASYKKDNIARSPRPAY